MVRWYIFPHGLLQGLLQTYAHIIVHHMLLLGLEVAIVCQIKEIGDTTCSPSHMRDFWQRHIWLV